MKQTAKKIRLDAQANGDVVKMDKCVDNNVDSVDNDMDNAASVDFVIENQNDKSCGTDDILYTTSLSRLKLKVLRLNKSRAQAVAMCKKLKEENRKKSAELRYQMVKFDLKKFTFYTGLKKTIIFDFILDLISIPKVCKLSREDHLLVVLVK